jgi:Cys-rich protein (TIGR01571 family)
MSTLQQGLMPQAPLMAQPMVAPTYGAPQLVQQPPTMHGGVGAVNMEAKLIMESGLCGCTNDMEVCCCGWCCAPCLAGQTHERAGINTKVPVICCYSLGMLASQFGVGIGCTVMADIIMCRARKEIQGLTGAKVQTDSEAFCTVCWCFPCVVCQEARAINKMWEANGSQPLGPIPVMHFGRPIEERKWMHPGNPTAQSYPPNPGQTPMQGQTPMYQQQPMMQPQQPMMQPQQPMQPGVYQQMPAVNQMKR